jgi:hypothetical protein
MQYMLLIYGNESDFGRLSAAEKGAALNEFMEFTQDIVRTGHFKAADRLQPTATASTVRVRNGKPVTTDGPFAETKEQLGGYYLIEAENLDEALRIAARIPAARWGAIEVRPVWAMAAGG